MSELVIGVSGINAADNPGPGTGIARSLKEDGELNARVIGLAYDALEPVAKQDTNQSKRSRRRSSTA